MAATGPRYSYFAAVTEADVDRFVVSTDMKVGTYTVANSGTMPTTGARHVTVTNVVAQTADTMGTVVVAGTNLDGEAISESFVPVADDIVTGSEWFVTVTSVTGAGWVNNTGTPDPDAITVGCTAAACVHEGDGVFNGVVVGETAAGAITLADSSGTVAVLKASIVEGAYGFGVQFDDYPTVTVAAASKLTVSSS